MLAVEDTAELQEFCTALHPARTAEFMEGLTPDEAWRSAQLRRADAAGGDIPLPAAGAAGGDRGRLRPRRDRRAARHAAGGRPRRLDEAGAASGRRRAAADVSGRRPPRGDAAHLLPGGDGRRDHDHRIRPRQRRLDGRRSGGGDLAAERRPGDDLLHLRPRRRRPLARTDLLSRAGFAPRSRRDRRRPHGARNWSPSTCTRTRRASPRKWPASTCWPFRWSTSSTTCLASSRTTTSSTSSAKKR